AYYPDWDATIIPPREVDMSKFDLINFAFAIPTSSYGVEFEEDDTDVIAELVKYAHGNNTKIVISVGGWTDSVYFSGAVSTATNRAKFVKNIAAMVTKYDVDGIDIDWEYPGGGGADGNEVSTKDTANFLLFLQALRTSLGTDKLISACTTQTAFLGADGSPLTDVSAFGEVLDHILVMNYDVWGASSTPGPNAPLSDACSGSLQPTANEESAIATWTAAGMPASKILMGVPSYGYISSSTKTTLVHKRSEPTPTRPLDLDALPNHNRGYSNSGTYKSPMHRRWELGRARNKKRKEEERAAKLAAEKEQANSLAKRQTDGNQIQFYELLSYGVIVESGATSTYTTYKGTNGYTLAWDTCSSTPYLYDVSRKVVITFDDPQSMVLKGQMAATKGIGGIGMWDISGDTPEWDLVNAFRVGMGLSS
ncbi:glycoside hydrolase, partial [Meredithblackwellia eburnea MCA 4105]